MLRKKGIVLTNDALPANGRESALSETGFSTTPYSDRERDGDRIVWMQHRMSPP